VKESSLAGALWLGYVWLWIRGMNGEVNETVWRGCYGGCLDHRTETGREVAHIGDSIL
jgi:hypothetical protein